MVIKTTISDCKRIIPNVYELVVLAAHRANELHRGYPPLIPTKNEGHRSVALREIAVGVIDPTKLREEIIRNRLETIEAQMWYQSQAKHKNQRQTINNHDDEITEALKSLIDGDDLQNDDADDNSETDSNIEEKYNASEKTTDTLANDLYSLKNDDDDDIMSTNEADNEIDLSDDDDDDDEHYIDEIDEIDNRNNIINQIKYKETELTISTIIGAHQNKKKESATSINTEVDKNDIAITTMRQGIAKQSHTNKDVNASKRKGKNVGTKATHDSDISDSMSGDNLSQMQRFYEDTEDEDI